MRCTLKTFSWNATGSNDDLLAETTPILQEGGVVCLPYNGTYRVMADFTSSDAVTRLLQSKRRTRDAPTLVLVSDMTMLKTITTALSPLSEHLTAQLWPGDLTILCPPNPDLDRRIIKATLGKKARFGVRIPQSPLILSVIAAARCPLLVSSANKERKQGAYSPAQVRQTFAGRIDLFVDAGDLSPGTPSTVIAVDDGAFKIVRQGVLPEARILEAVASYDSSGQSAEEVITH